MCLTGLKSWTSEAPVVSTVFLVEMGSPLAWLVVGRESMVVVCGISLGHGEMSDECRSKFHEY